MSEAVVAKRYAEALFQLGSEKDSLQIFVDHFLIVKQVFQKNDKLHAFLNHPRVNESDKQRFINESFQGLTKDVINTLLLLVNRHRVDIISEIIDQFIHLVNDAKGIAEAKVYSVRELKETELADLEKMFAKRFNKKEIQLKNIVDPSIIGGIKFRIGNTILDGTISGKLKRIERNIKLANN